MQSPYLAKRKKMGESFNRRISYHISLLPMGSHSSPFFAITPHENVFGWDFLHKNEKRNADSVDLEHRHIVAIK
jgi:hypothetical protein